MVALKQAATSQRPKLVQCRGIISKSYEAVPGPLCNHKWLLRNHAKQVKVLLGAGDLHQAVFSRRPARFKCTAQNGRASHSPIALAACMAAIRCLSRLVERGAPAEPSLQGWSSWPAASLSLSITFWGAGHVLQPS